MGVGTDHVGGSGVDRFEERDRFAPRHARRQEACLGSGAGHVVVAGVRHVHPGQLADDRLVFERGLQRAWLISGW